MKIKVCGMRSPANLEEVCALGPDLVGFIFYPGSKRYVGDQPDPALFRVPGPGINKVGVFVNESLESVQKIADSARLELVQLHGDEGPEYCRSLSGQGLRVIKAVDVIRDAHRLGDYQEHVEFFLFDTPDPGYGGTGRKFDWKLLSNISSSHAFLLGGGIGPGDAGTLLGLGHEGLLGVDLNSRFESSPGFKEVSMLRAFMQELKKE